MSIALSRRLQAVASHVPAQAVVADIGSDHALLPLYLVQQQLATAAFACELNAGPFAAAQAGVRAAAPAVAARVTVRRGDGFAAVSPDDGYDTVTICGMGGALIAAILDAGNAAGKLARVRRLVLQPNVGEEFVRRWLCANAWKLVHEELLEEDGKRYEVLVADRAQSSADAQQWNEQLYKDLPPLTREWKEKMGPMLVAAQSDLFRQKWREEADKLSNIVAQMRRESTTESAREKWIEFERQIETMKEIVGWTS